VEVEQVATGAQSKENHPAEEPRLKQNCQFIRCRILPSRLEEAAAVEGQGSQLERTEATLLLVQSLLLAVVAVVLGAMWRHLAVAVAAQEKMGKALALAPER
jgi:hypothetical protein